MRKTLRDKKKRRVLEELSQCGGLVATACSRAGISPATYYAWIKEDEIFREKSEEIQELQGDKVESALMTSILEGSEQAQIFYCKTKLKKRGYTERDNVGNKETAVDTSASPSPHSSSVDARVEEIKQMMKDEGIYYPKFDMQIRLAAATAAQYDRLYAETLKPDYQPIITQISREGNERQVVNAVETALQQKGEQLQSQLRALGLNVDAKPVKGSDDSVNDFLSAFNE